MQLPRHGDSIGRTNLLQDREMREATLRALSR
jgi:hypothetical protein